jgi:hypothetical protein
MRNVGVHMIVGGTVLLGVAIIMVLRKAKWGRFNLLLAILTLFAGITLIISPEPPPVYESRAILEVPHDHHVSPKVAGDPQLAELRAMLQELLRRTEGLATSQADLPGIRVHMLSWNSVRDLILTEKVDFGRQVGPDNPAAIEAVYDYVCQNTRLSALGPRYVSVTFRGPDPVRNATIVNELVKQFVTGTRQRAQDEARADMKYCADGLAVATSNYNEAAGRLRAFDSANPWLTGSEMADLIKEHDEARERELVIREQCNEAEEELAAITQHADIAQAKDKAAVEAERVELKKKIDRLMSARLKQNERVSKLYTMVHRGPELLAKRSALEETVAHLKEAVDWWSRGARVADRELQRVLSAAHGTRYTVVEYARDTRIPVE